MRRGALLGLALSLLAAQAALAQEAPRLEPTLDAPAPIKPGGTADTLLQVRYCYRASGAVPATVVVAVDPAPPAWLAAAPDPARFQATTSGSPCGSRDVTVHLNVGRQAPAFEPTFLQLKLQAQSSGTATEEAEAQAPVQADYWAEVDVKKPERIRVQRGDAATLRLLVAVGANDGTRLEVTGSEERGMLTMQGAIVDTQAGSDLDRPDSRTLELKVAASPFAPLGVGRLQVNVTAFASERPGLLGERATVIAEVQVLEANDTPPAPLGLALLAMMVLALARRRGP